MNRVNAIKGLLIFAVISLCSWSPSLRAQCQSLKVAFAKDWYPVAFANTSGKPQAQGLAYQLLEAIAEQQRVELEWLHSIPWKRALAWMDSGDIDVLAGHYSSEYRQENWLVSAPWFINQITVLHNQGDLGPAVKADLLTSRGGHPAGASYGDELDRFIKDELNLIEFKNNTLLVTALLKKRVDYIVIAKSDAQAHMMRLDTDNSLKIADLLLAELSVHFSFSKHSPCAALFDAFNQGVREQLKAKNIEQWISTVQLQYFEQDRQGSVF